MSNLNIPTFSFLPKAKMFLKINLVNQNKILFWKGITLVQRIYTFFWKSNITLKE